MRMTVSAGARQPVTSELHAVVTRADGTTVDLGRVSYSHRNPVKHLLGNLEIKLRLARRNRQLGKSWPRILRGLIRGDLAWT